MKWIGQNIYDFISRFRNDVYLENIPSGTVAAGGNLGLDSNNKIVKHTGGDITSINLSATTGIDITSISGSLGGDYAATIGVDVSDFMTNGLSSGGILTSTGADAMTANSYLTFSNDAGESDTSTLSIVSNQDIGDKFTIGTTTHGATTITTLDDDAAAASLTFNVDGNIFHKNTSGISEWYKSGNDDDKFRIAVGTHGDTTLTTIDDAATAAHFEIVADGDITLDSAGQIKLEPVAGNNILLDGTIAVDAGVVTGATSITSTAFVGTLSTAVQPNITTVGTLDTGNATAIVDTASLTTAGKVELATTAEADTGTDTARAVTPAGLKSHVDARYAYQYIMFHASDIIKSNWITFGQNGLTNHTWGTDTSDSGVIVDESTMSCTNVMQVAAFKIPFACKLVGFYGTGHRYGSSSSFSAGVFILDSPDYNSEASGSTVDTLNATLRAYAAAEDGGVSNPFNQKLNKVVDTGRSFDCPAGSMIFPAFKDTAGVNSGSFRGNMTVILATPIITIPE